MSHKARTLLVTTQFPPPMMGGTLVYYSHIPCRCRKGDYFVMAPHKENDADFDLAFSHPIFRTSLLKRNINRYFKIFLKPTLTLRILVCCIKNKINVIHIGDRYPLASAQLVSAVLRIKTIRTFHGEDLSSAIQSNLTGNSPIKKALASYEKFLFRQLTGAQVNSDNTHRLLNLYDQDCKNVLLTKPCVDTSKVSIMDEPIHGFSEKFSGNHVILTVGRLDPHKGHIYVINSLPSVLKTQPNLVYIIVAAYATDEQVICLTEHAKKLSVSENVFIFRNLSPENLVWLFKQSTLFIMPNRNLPGNISEGYGIVFLEAGLFRLPCIGGNAGGVPEAVDDGITGLLVDGSLEPSISQAILRLLETPDLCRELGENGYKKAMASNWDERSIEYQSFLDRLVS